MNFHSRKHLSMLIPVYLLASCISEKKDNQVRSTADATSNLAGKWTTECVIIENGSYKQLLEVSKGLWVNKTYGFSDQSCEDQVSEQNQVIRFVSGKTLKTPTGAREFSSTKTKITITPKTESAAEELREIYGSTCKATFTSGKSTDLTADLCSRDDALFDTVYSIYLVDGSKLFFGDCSSEDTSSDCSTPENRAKELVNDLVFIKQK